LRAAGMLGSRALHLGLLMTASGELCWLEVGMEASEDE